MSEGEINYQCWICPKCHDDHARTFDCESSRSPDVMCEQTDKAIGIEQPTIEICDCENKYSIEQHGDAHALYFGRCNHRHGYNLARISEISFNCELKELERLLNRKDT